jgi:CubicO group peptidase (beta-lactamase class C family)
MRDSGYNSAFGLITGCANGYRREGVASILVADTCSDKSTSPQSVGGIYSTVYDLYRWDRALYSGALVSKKSLDQMFTPYRDGYGFGWKTLKEFQRKAIVYGGRTSGFSTSIRRYPDDDACVVVLSNLEGVDAEKISHDLGAIMFGAHYAMPAESHAVQ